MPVAIQHLPERDLTIFRVHGETSLAEQLDVLRDFYNDAPTHKVIWDFTDLSGERVSTDDLRHIIDFVKSHGSARMSGRTALVAPNQLDFGLSRMSSLLAEGAQLDWEMAAFRSREEALRWLEVE